MSIEAPSKSSPTKNSCGCGGHVIRPDVAIPTNIGSVHALKFTATPPHKCNCGHACPRKYLVWSGFLLGGFLVLHFSANLLGIWPERFQRMVSLNHSIGSALPALEIGLIFIPLGIHLVFGLRTLSRERLRFGIVKHHHGSDLRNWLQRVSATILFGFILFHVATMHRWLGGRFDSHNAFNTASQTIWQFWSNLPAGHPANALVAHLYLLGIVAAVYHLANGIATGTEVLGWVETSAAQRLLWHICLAAALMVLLAGLGAWYALGLKNAP